jgi:hypothetical protein
MNISEKIDIKNDINNNYLLFLEKNELIRFSLVSNWKINRIKKKFAKKCILVIVLNNIHEINNYTYLNKSLRFNDLEYPQFNSFYILLNTKNFKNEIVVNYYTHDIYFYKMKSYKHNFLVFLAQSFGASEITWSSEIKNSKNQKISIKTEASYNTITAKEEYKREDNSNSSINNNQELKYDNFGSEIYFLISKNLFSWTDRDIYNSIFEILKSYSNKSEILKNIEKILFEKNIERLINKSEYFSYDFYINEPLLVDFVRKRVNGMLSINHEMVYSNNHRTILKYFSELGSNYWVSLKLNYNYDSENSLFDKTNYYVKFYDTELLEVKTLELLLMEKNLNQIKSDQEEIRKNKILILKNEIKELNDSKKEIFSNDKTYYLKKYKRLYQLANIEDINKDNKKNSEKTYKYNHLKYFNDNINDIIKDFLIVFDHSIGNIKVEQNKIILWIKNIPSDFFNIIVNEIFTDIDINNKFDQLIQDIYQLNEKDTLYFSIHIMENSSFYDKNNVEHKKIITNIPGYDNYKIICEQKKINAEKNKNVIKIELFNKIDNNNYANCNGVYIKDSVKLINEYPTYVNIEKSRFIGWSCGCWVLTGIQWYDEFVESTKIEEKSFGGFHSSTNDAKSVNNSIWKEYLIQCEFE